MLKIHNFGQPFDQSVLLVRRCSMYTTLFFWVILTSTPPCFDHISLIQTYNGAPFFLLVSLFFREHSIQIS